jgi:hypothetical protein
MHAARLLHLSAAETEIQRTGKELLRSLPVLVSWRISIPDFCRLNGQPFLCPPLKA